MTASRLIPSATLALASLVAACFPEPAVTDLTLPLITLIPHGECLFAGRSSSVANSGVLACAALNSYQCGSTLFFKSASERTTLGSAVSAIGSGTPSCLTPSSNALTKINSLALPAFLYMQQSGGTTGTHSSGNFTISLVDSCANVGLSVAPFVVGTGRLATNIELGFLTSSRGLVAIEDAGGTCRTDMGLSTGDNAIAQSVISGQVVRTASCDYGADDATKTDCPAALQRADYMFSGITVW